MLNSKVEAYSVELGRKRCFQTLRLDLIMFYFLLTWDVKKFTAVYYVQNRREL